MAYSKMRNVFFLFMVFIAGICILAGCGATKTGVTETQSSQSPEQIEIAFASCCVTEDVTTKVLVPMFEDQWAERTGNKVKILPTFAGSGTLTNNIVGGNDVQVALLSSELYAQQLRDKGLTETDWRTLPHDGVAIKSTIVFLVREGNPKQIYSFTDLTKPGVEIIHSSPDTSGGAQWAIYAIYGSALRESEMQTGVQDEQRAFQLLQNVENNVIAMPESAKQAAAQFDAGQGDVIITYENEALLELQKGKPYEMIVPQRTVETGWTVVKLDSNIQTSQEEIVDQFITFLYSDEAQAAYAEYGYRSINDDITAKFDQYAEIDDPFTLDYFGGVERARAEIIDHLWKQTQKR